MPATSAPSIPSKSSAPLDTPDAVARPGRIWQSYPEVEGLVRVNRVEVESSSAH
jgi:hypothetical protein